MAVYEKHVAAMVRSGEAGMNDDLKKSPAIYRDFDELEQRVLAMGSAAAFDAATTTGRDLTKMLVANGVLRAQELSDALERACVSEAPAKIIAVEYHAPEAQGRRKVGGAQWKSERRGGFSRR